VIAGRERRAFELFVHASSDRLVRTAHLLVGDRGHAEDIVQTALLRTAQRWRWAKQSPEAYARRVVVNLAKDRWRHLSRRPSEQALRQGISAVGTDEILERDAVVRAAMRLPLGQRTVLVLRYFEDMSVEDTARALGCSKGTVKSQTSRALASMRAALAYEENDDAEGDRYANR
jgi:RNA polymerase sigma-70 factor (sigma-E family)